jgi:hypothetical protein
MKKQMLEIKHFCDICKKESNEWNCCNNCGKNICYECKKTEAKEYTHSVWASGSGDGLYCLQCDQELIVSGNAKHAAYRTIESLKRESNGFYTDFKSRAEKAELKLKSFK